MSSTQTPTSPSSSSSLPKLGPAWYRAAGGNKGGFRPPPAVPLDNNKQQQQQQQRPSSGGNVNSFSALLLEEDDEEPTTTTAPPTRAASTMTTTEVPRPLFQRNPSSGGGRSLAELAAAAAPTASSTMMSRTNKATDGSSFRKSVDDQPIVRYTREKLLAMRPSCSISLPTLLQPLQGNVILANHALDPGTLYYSFSLCSLRVTSVFGSSYLCSFLFFLPSFLWRIWCRWNLGSRYIP